MKLSLVVPCYNEEGNVADFYNAVCTAFEGKIKDFEVIFVNDGSRDDTLNNLHIIHQNAPENTAVVSFSRNFGKEAAIFAGLRHARGDMVTFIDADLQQRPEVVCDMVEFLNTHPEYDSVAAYQDKRKEGAVLRGFKKLFYKMINKMSETEFKNGASDFRTVRRCVADAILSMQEYSRFSKGIFSWVGFETYYMPYEVQARNSGESKWSFWKLFSYAVEGFVSFSTFPLKLATYAGIIASFSSILYLIIVILQKLIFSIDVPGYTTIVVLILFIGGVQLLILGIIGEYLARIYLQGKNRPIYIEKEYLSVKSGNADNNTDLYIL